MKAAALLLGFVGVSSGALNPADYDYCNVSPLDYAIPTINPSGLKMQQLQTFIRHGDRTRAFGGPCWPADAIQYDCPLSVAVGSSITKDDSFNFTRVYRKQYMDTFEGLPGDCGMGQLSMRGRQQEMDNGKVLRNAYGSWLPDLNTPSEKKKFLFRSTDYHRTIQSGQLLVDSLFPPPAMPRNMVSQIEWNTLDSGYDPLILPGAICPFAQTVIDISKQHPDFEDHMTTTGIPLAKALQDALDAPSYLPYINLANTIDCVMTNVCENKAVPAKLTEPLVQGVADVSAWQWEFYLNYNNNQGLRTHVGFIAKEMLQALKTIFPSITVPVVPANNPISLHDIISTPSLRTSANTESNADPLRFVLFSGHDVGPMYPILVGLEAYDDNWPAYASMFNIEFWSNESNPSSINGAYVRMIFKGVATSPSFCSFPIGNNLCPLSDFLAHLASLIPTEADCGLVDEGVEGGIEGVDLESLSVEELLKLSREVSLPPRRADELYATM